MKKLMMLFCFLLGTWFTYGQEVTIGAGTSTNKYPFGATYGFERSATLYTATEIGQSGFINSLAWNISGTATPRPIKIYLKEVESSTLIAADWTTYITGATLVHEGIFNPSVGFYAIDLFPSFNYTGGTKNLLVLVESTYGGSGGGGNFNVSTTNASNMHFFAQADHAPPTGNLGAISSRPNLKITFGPAATCVPARATITELSPTGFSFTLTNPEAMNQIAYEVRTSGAAGSGATGLAASGTITDLSTLPLQVTGLEEETEYSFYVRSICETGPSSFSGAIPLRTLLSGVIGTGNNVSTSLPITSSYSYNYSQMIYTVEEVTSALNDYRLITKIKLFYAKGTAESTKYEHWSIYMANTNQTSFPNNSSWINHASLTPVFSGNLDLSLPAGRWVEITLDEPFVWDGISNLALAVYEDSPGYSYGVEFRTFATSENRGIIKYRDAIMTPEQAIVESSPSTYKYVPQLYLGGIESPACYIPLGLRATNIGEDSFQLNWLYLAGSTNNGAEYYIATTDTPPTDDTLPTGAVAQGVTSAELTGLTANTVYYVFMRTLCTDGSKTIWTPAFQVRTSMIPADIPYQEDFENNPEYLFTNGSTNKWFIDSAVNNGGTHALYISNNDGENNRYTTNVAQATHAYKDFTVAEDTEQLVIEFDWRSVGEEGQDGFRVWAVPTSFNPRSGIEITASEDRQLLGKPLYDTNDTFRFERIIMDATPFAGETMRLVFEWKQNASGGTQPPAAIDNLSLNVVTCRMPEGFTFSAVAETELTVSWEEIPAAASYDLYISRSITAPTQNPPVLNVTDTTHTFTNLEHSTIYYVWVRARCSASDQSYWVGPLVINTVVVPVALPFEDNFESTPRYGFINDSTNKWVIGNAINNGGTKSLYISENEGATNTYKVKGAQTSHIYKDFIIPNDAVDITIKFDWRCVGESSWDRFRIWAVPLTYTVTAGTDITAGNGRIQLGKTHYSANSVFLTEDITAVISSFAGQTMRLVFEWKQDTSGGTQPPAAIDNLKIGYSKCARPSAVAVNSVEAEQAVVTWTNAPGVAAYDVFVSLDFTPPLGTTTPTYTGVTSPHTLVNLQPNNRYYVWVRSSCSAANKSYWIGGVGFLTKQIPGNIPFSDGFETSFDWTNVLGNKNAWVNGNAVNNGGGMSLYVSSDEGRTHDYDIETSSISHSYRDILIPEGMNEITISYDWLVKGELNNTEPRDYFRLVKVAGTTTPVSGTLLPITGVNKIIGRPYYVNSNGWKRETATLNVNAHQGEVIRLVFEWVNNYSGGEQPPAAIDNVNIVASACPNVIDPIATIVRHTTNVRLSWAPQGEETKWELFINNQGEPEPDIGDEGIIIEGEPTYLIENIEAGQFFVYYVRAICEGPTGRNMLPWIGPTRYSYFLPPVCAEIDGGIEDMPVSETNNYVICEDGPVTKKIIAQHAEAKSTSSYRIESIEYAPPFPFLGGIEMPITSDDDYTASFDLPFDFCFFGESYNYCQIGDNGVVTFGRPYTTVYGDYCSYQLSGKTIPDTTFPIKNSIYGIYQDMLTTNNPGPNSQINYQVLGTFPCRALVVNFSEVPSYSSPRSACEGEEYRTTTQIVLYEITNIIEVYVKHRKPCMNWPSSANEKGQGVLGIQNAAGTLAYVPEGRNTGPWIATEEAWRFVPDGEGVTTFQWYKDGEPFSTEQEIEVVITESVNYTAKATYTACEGNELVVDRIFNFLKEDFEVPELSNYYVCGETTDPNNSTQMDISSNKEVVFTSLGESNRENYKVEYFRNEALTEPVSDLVTVESVVTVYTKVTNLTTGCFKVETFDAVRVPPVIVTKLESVELCGGYLLPELAEGEQYFTSSNGQGKEYKAGDFYDVIGNTTVFIYKEIEGGCFGESTFKALIHEDVKVDEFEDKVMMCDIFILPELSKYNRYFSEPNGKGIEYFPGMPILEPTTIYVYAFNGSDTVQCIEESSFSIDYKDCPITKGISPNGDGVNESFDLSKHGVSKLQIFNRNGVEVYSHGLGYTNQWIGQNSSNKLLPAGTYYYVVISNGKLRTGWVQLNY